MFFSKYRRYFLVLVVGWWVLSFDAQTSGVAELRDRQVEQALVAGDQTNLSPRLKSIIDWATSDATIDGLVNAEKNRQEKEKRGNRRLLASASLEPFGIKNVCVGLYASDVKKGVLVGVDLACEALFHSRLQAALSARIGQQLFASPEDSLRIGGLIAMLELPTDPVGAAKQDILLRQLRAEYERRSIFTKNMISMLFLRLVSYDLLAHYRDYHMLNDAPQCISELVQHVRHPSPDPIPVFTFFQTKLVGGLPSDIVQADFSDIAVALAKEYGLMSEWTTGKFFEWAKQFFLYVVCVKTLYKDVFLDQWLGYCQRNSHAVAELLNAYAQAVQAGDDEKITAIKRDIEKHIQIGCKIKLSTWLGHKQNYGMVWNISWNALRLAPAVIEMVMLGKQFWTAVQQTQRSNQGDLS